MIRFLTACLLLAVMGCGDDSESVARACDPAMNGSLAGPMPGPQAVFRLAPESTVQFPNGFDEAVTGWLLVSDCFSPNTLFAGRIETLRFVSTSLLVQSGCAAVGRVVSSTLYGGDMPTSLTSSVRVNDVRLSLGGSGPPYRSGRLQLNLTAGDYRFLIVAILESRPSEGDNSPSCEAWGFA
jgi:hypothetical protein